MKVLAINGSPRADGNTSMLIDTVLGELHKADIETEKIQLGGKNIHGCTACMKCAENQNGRCVIDNDVLNDVLGKMIEADGIIIGTPTYFANVSTEIKALIDRAGIVSIVNGYLLRRKVGAAVVAVRRAGSTNAFDAVNKLFLINQMVLPGSVYWNLGFGLHPHEVKDDEEGMKTMTILGENMAWLLKKLT